MPSDYDRAIEDAARVCDAEVDRANAQVKAWTFNGGREAAAMVERHFAAEARTCAAAIRALPRPAAPPATKAASGDPTTNPYTCPTHQQPWGTIYKDGSIEYDCGCNAPPVSPEARNANRDGEKCPSCASAYKAYPRDGCDDRWHYCSFADDDRDGAGEVG
jgi:hypothetical protein